MSEALEFLVNLLDLETIEVNTYRGKHPEEERQRTFGGQVAAQALMAAGRTAEVGRIRSRHPPVPGPGSPRGTTPPRRPRAFRGPPATDTGAGPHPPASSRSSAAAPSSTGNRVFTSTKRAS